MRVKVTAANTSDQSEVQLGIFNQGVVFDGETLIDVATSEVVAKQTMLRGQWFTPGGNSFDRVYIQGC